MTEKDVDILIKLQGTVEGPRNDEEYTAYREERDAAILKDNKPTWILLNYDPELDGRAWEYYSPDRKDEVMQLRASENSGLFEASKGVDGEIGSGLMSLSAAVEFVETK